MWEFIKYCLQCVARGLYDATGMTWKDMLIGMATVTVLIGIGSGLLKLLYIIFEKIEK